MDWSTLSALADGLMVKMWITVPAVIDTMEVKESRGDDSLTYELKATYHYQVDGKDYSSDRVGLHTGADNIGDWHRRTYSRLDAERSQEKVVAYVNPRHPEQAYLAPDMRWGVIAFKGVLGLVFTAVGGGLFFGVVLGKGKNAKAPNAPEVTKRPYAESVADSPRAKLLGESGQGEADSENDDEDEDEDDDEDWKSTDPGEDFVANPPVYTGEQRILKHSHGQGIAFLAVFSLIWNGFSWTLLILLFHEFMEKAKHEPMMWMILLFPLAGVGMLWGLVNTIIRHLRYGVSTLEMATMPGILGGKFSGAVTCRGNLADSRSVEVALSCVRETSSVDSDGDRRTTSSTVWNDSYELRADSLPRTGGTTTIPVLFAVPYDQPMTGSAGNTRVNWKVNVTAVRPGADFNADWTVPVYRTRESQRGYQLESNPLTSFMLDPDPDDALNRSGVSIRSTAGGGKSWFFRPTPLRSGAPGCFMFILIFAAILTAMVAAKAPFIAMAVLALLIVASVAILLQMLLGRSEIRLENGVLSVNGGFAGFNKTATYPLANVQSIGQTNSMTSGDSVYYKLQFLMADSKKVTAGNQLKGQRLLDYLKTSVQSELNRQRR